MKKVVIDLTSLSNNFSGIERYALKITQELIKHADTSFILLFRGEISKRFVDPFPSNVQTVVISGGRLATMLFKIPTYINKTLPDAAVFFAFPPSFLRRIDKRVKVYCTIHDMVAYDVPKTMKFKSRLYFRRGYQSAKRQSANIFTVSSFSKGRISSILKYPADKILVTPNGCDLKPSEGKSDIYEKYHLPRKYCLCLSTLEPRKNFGWLANEMASLWKDNPDYPDLVLVGRKGWKMDDFLNNIDPSAASRIHLTGFIDDEDLYSIYRSAECFVFPSIYEGFGIPLIESINSGALPLASAIPPSLEILGSDYPFAFKLGDSQEFREKLDDLLALDKEKKAALLYSLKKEVQKFNWKDSADIVFGTIING